MAVTIENVKSRTLLEQFHSLYENQQEQQTALDNLDTKIDQETIDRQTADLSINSEIQALKDQIDSLGVLFTYKGEVATIQDLPLIDNVPGDVYYVDSEQSGYIWLEKSGVYQWEQFGPAIDLSEYAKQEDLEQLESEVDAMNTQVESNASNIVSLTNTKQDKLTAGTNITIDENNVISASGGSDAVTLTTDQTITGKKGFEYNGTDPRQLPLYVSNEVGGQNAQNCGLNYKGLCYVSKNPFATGYKSYKLDKDGFGLSKSSSAPSDIGSFPINLNFPDVSNGTYTLALTSDIDAKVPDAPSVDGTYTLKCVVSNGGTTKTYQWELIASSGGSGD